jgi:hypothetical protein
MRSVMIVSLVLVVLTSAATVLGGEMKPAIYLGGGMSMPSSPATFSDYWKTGYGGMASLAFATQSNVEVAFTLGYTQFPINSDKVVAYAEDMLGESVPADAVIDGFDTKALEILADVKYIFGAAGGAKPFGPFILASAGMTSLSFSDGTVTGDGETQTADMSDISSTKLTAGVGAGFQYMFKPKTGFWVDARYMMITTDGETTSHIPIRAGIKVLFGSN